SGNFAIDVRTSPSQPPSRGEASVQLVIRDKNGAPHPGLTLSVTPSVTETTPGTYVVSNVDLFMAGTWELRTAITGDVSDHATPSFQIE
ncbi:MAG: hypothetical protein ACRELY_02240, partial [Polyangiaceae bacterium]